MKPIPIETETQYTRPAIVLHWIIALLIVTMIPLGYFMVGLPRNTPERSFYLNLHKSLGLLTLALVLIRLGWRATHTPPPLPLTMPVWQRKASVLSHGLLYACILVQPLTGYVSSSFGKYGVKFFGLKLPNWGWDDPALRDVFVAVHETVAVILIVLVTIHVLAALKHLLLDRDTVFRRMLP